MRNGKKIAFIGLGKMGVPMADNLLRAGFAVEGFDLSEAARSALRDIGGVAAASVTEAFANTDYIITMLPNGKIVQDALTRDDVYKLAPKGSILLEMSSSAPAQTRALAEQVSGYLRVVDAPVSGGVKRAVDGTLAIMVGGSDADYRDALPVLEVMAAKLFFCGPVGAGHAMKAINNYVSGAGVAAAAEAVLLGEAFGLDAGTIVDVLNASSGKNNATEVKMKQFVLSGTFASGFAMGLMAKDIRTAADLSASLGLDQPGLRQTAKLWDDAVAVIGGSADHTRFYEFLARQGARRE